MSVIVKLKEMGKFRMDTTSPQTDTERITCMRYAEC